jgi:glucose/arabinose dehydrogenase
MILFLSIWVLPVFGEPTSNDPVLKDPDYVVEKFVSGIENSPTTMAFVGDDILVLQKTDGKVRLIRDGVLQTEPVLDVSVRGFAEQGMLGITVVDSSVYLYFSEAKEDGGVSVGNKIYRYDWNGEKLINPILIKTLPGAQFYHNGGAMVTGSDGSVYAVIGDQGNYGLLQNHDTAASNDTSVILRIAPEGPYYAMGIRNSFGLAIDPVTGNLWDTENGDEDFDEVNFVPPNFNSGWEVIMGPANETELAILPGYDGYVYSDPEFSWQQVVAPTAISFIDSKPLEKFKNNVFAGDCIYGNLYKFELNPDRTGFVFHDAALSDNVVNTGESMDELIFGTGFGCLTDIEVGPDGLLYILSLSEGTIYKIMPKTMMPMDEVVHTQPVHFPIEYTIYAVIAALIIAGIIIYLIKVKRKSK